MSKKNATAKAKASKRVCFMATSPFVIYFKTTNKPSEKLGTYQNLLFPKEATAQCISQQVGQKRNTLPSTTYITKGSFLFFLLAQGLAVCLAQVVLVGSGLAWWLGLAGSRWFYWLVALKV
jgi:hypothetical protein